ncbi:MAG: adenylyl-sulfate kinase, partial [Nocardioidaceae bacterium]|nr:adenylyl-sulfate kinase [Nocardioidaceae bacterium]
MPDPLPQHCPSPRELDDLELLAHGVLGLRGFEGPGGLVTLRVPTAVAAAAQDAGGLELVDPEGLPLARVDVTSTYDAGDAVGIAGPVTALAHHEFGPFRRLHLTPEQLAAAVGTDTLTVPVTAPLSKADLETIGARAGGSPVVLLALVGTGTPEGLSPEGLLRATLAGARELPRAEVVAVPLASRGDASADRELAGRVTAAYASGEVL